MRRSVSLVVLVLTVWIAGSVAWAEESVTSAIAGEELFDNNCSACHSLDKGDSGIAPSLYGVIGRHVASLPNYGYSAAIKAYDMVWTEDNLKRYLLNPQAQFRCHNLTMGHTQECLGIRMPFRGFADPKEADAVIAYLKVVAGKN